MNWKFALLALALFWGYQAPVIAQEDPVMESEEAPVDPFEGEPDPGFGGNFPGGAPDDIDMGNDLLEEVDVRFKYGSPDEVIKSQIEAGKVIMDGKTLSIRSWEQYLESFDEETQNRMTAFLRDFMKRLRQMDESIQREKAELLGLSYDEFRKLRTTQVWAHLQQRQPNVGFQDINPNNPPKLHDVVEEDDTATATLKYPDRDEEYPMEFVKEDGKWRVRPDMDLSSNLPGLDASDVQRGYDKGSEDNPMDEEPPSEND